MPGDPKSPKEPTGSGERGKLEKEPTHSGERRRLEEITGSSLGRARDGFEDSKVRSDPRAKPLGPTAPEVASKFKERAFVPRGSLTKDEIVTGLREALGALEPEADPLEAWMPFIRQAVEQAGGDGVDCELRTLLKPPGKPATTGFLGDLRKAFARLHHASPADRAMAAGQVIETARLALEAPSPVSLKALSKDLEGKADLEVLLGVVLASDEALTAREAQVTLSLESLRAQLKQMPGGAPEGMLWNFARLKTERDLILAERSRR